MLNVSTISYSIAALAYASLFLLLLISWRGRLQGALLICTAFVSMLWALAATYYSFSGFQRWPDVYAVLELIRSFIWLVFLIELFRALWRFEGRKRTLVYMVLGVWTGLLALLELNPLIYADKAYSVNIALFGHLSLALLGLVLIEQLFRNTRLEQRWATKYLYLGVGALFAYDFFLYADALLFKQIDPSIWSARGLLNSMTVPMLAVAAARNPNWSLDVFISRSVVFHTVSLAGAGAYLLTMGLVGYYVRIFGGEWGTTLQTAFLAGAALLMLILLFSGRLRAKVRVFLSKHFFSYKYDYREEWLTFTAGLSNGESTEPLRERAIRSLAKIVHCTSGTLWTADESRLFTMAAAWHTTQSLELKVPSTDPVVAFLERTKWVIDFAEMEGKPDLYDQLAFPDWLRNSPQAWLIVPLLIDDKLYGWVVLADPIVKQSLNWEDRDLLKTAGRQLASYIALLEVTEALATSRQFEAFHRLSAYVVHDLKNVIAQLSLIVTNAARHKHKPAFIDDAMATVEHAVGKMNRMLAQLNQGTPVPASVSKFALKHALQEAVNVCSQRRPIPAFVLNDSDMHLYADRERCVAVLQHLIQNAQDACSVDGNISLKVYRDDTMAVVEITDDGCGMDEQFIRESLFRPFTTTKGNAGMGIGVYESREFARSLGGDLEVISKPKKGTTFFLRLSLTRDNLVH